MSDEDSGSGNGGGVVPDEPESRGLDGSRIDDTLQQAFEPGTIEYGVAEDNLASPRIQGNLPLAPPLTLKSFVCLADTSSFVLRRKGWGDEVARFEAHEVKRAEGGGYYVSLLDAIGSGAPWVEIFRALDRSTGRVPVEPVRPQCRHLAQQLVDLQDASTEQLMERLCTARRDEQSFFVSLRDTQVHACELRSPKDPVSAERIAIFNETKLTLGRLRVEEGGVEFDVDGALEERRAEADKGLSVDSIFSDSPKGR